MVFEFLKTHPWWRRLAGVAFGCSILLGVECCLRLFGVGEADPAVDPFVGFSRVELLFVLDPAANRYVTSPSRQQFFVEDGFARKKAAGTFRIFCLGGSTVQGRPYSIETAFPKWLELELEASQPGRDYEVVNCGGVSYASYRLIPILQECLGYEPDLIVVCTGHNEFLEERTYGHIKPLAERGGSFFKTLSQSRIYRVAQKGAGKEGTAPRAILKEEVDALLDYRGGLEAYHRDPEWRAGVAAHFASNLWRMIAIGRDARVPMLFLSPPSNLKDCPPFKSLHGNGLSELQRAQFSALVKGAESHYRDDPAKAVALLEQAVEIDAEFALTHFSLGKLHLSQANPSRATAAFERSLEEDICPLRMLGGMRKEMATICADTEVPYIDLQAWAEGEAGFGIPGEDVLVDHIHPTIQGHQKIAHLLANTIEEKRAVDWEQHLKASREEHMASLGELYFAHGNERLSALRSWTEGRADGPPIDEHQTLGVEQR